MASPTDKLKEVVINVPSSGASNKKRIAKSDGLTAENELRQNHDDMLSGDRIAPGTHDMSDHFNSTTSGRVVKPPARFGTEEQTRKEGLAHSEGSAGKTDNAEDASDRDKNDHNSDYGSGKSTPKRNRKCKKQVLDKPKDTIESLHLKLEESRKLYDDEKTENKKLKAENKMIKKKKADAIHEIKRRSKAQTELRAKIKACEEIIKDNSKTASDLKRRLSEKEKYIEDNNEDVFRRLGKEANDALDDNYVREKLQEMRMAWQNWASEYAISSLVGINKQYIEDLLERAVPYPVSIPQQQELCPLFMGEPGAPRMLLGILVSYTVCETLFQEPFSFLEGAHEVEKTGLQGVLDHGMLGNEEMTHAWRQLTMKILNLEPSAAVPSAGKDTNDVHRFARVRDSHYDRIVERIHGDGSLLLDGLDEDSALRRRDELEQMIRKVGDVSALLWSQKAQTRWSILDFDRPFEFHARLQIVKAHPCMCLDEESHRYDGRRVEIVIEPAILALGSEEGKNYDQQRTRLPALGWWPEKDPEQTTPGPPPPKDALDLRSAHAGAVKTCNDGASQHERPAKRQKYGEKSANRSGTISEQQAGGQPVDVKTSAERTEGVSKQAPPSTATEQIASGKSELPYDIRLGCRRNTSPCQEWTEAAGE